MSIWDQFSSQRNQLTTELSALFPQVFTESWDWRRIGIINAIAAASWLHVSTAINCDRGCGATSIAMLAGLKLSTERGTRKLLCVANAKRKEALTSQLKHFEKRVANSTFRIVTRDEIQGAMATTIIFDNVELDRNSKRTCPSVFIHQNG